MSYKILPTKQFEKDFKKIDSSIQKRISDKMNEVSLDPTRYKRLRHSLNKFCRIRIDKYRIIFDYDAMKKELYLRKIVFDHNY